MPFSDLDYVTLDFVTVAYAAMFLCFVIIQVVPWSRITRVLALASLLFASVGGVAWSYIAMQSKADWGDLTAAKWTPDSHGNERRPAYLGGMGGREIDPEEANTQSAASRGSVARGSSVGGGATAGGRASDARVAQSRIGHGGKGSNGAQATTGRVEDAPFEKDCALCPELVQVPAGSGVIGASAIDGDALSHELPRRRVRFWPGYMIGVAAVSAESFAGFQRERGRSDSSCDRRLAANSAAADDFAVGALAAFSAGCVTPGDADAYVRWLSERTGKSYRLPTAAEWDYAVRTLPESALARGEVSEIVADCFSPVVPEQGEGRIAARSDPAQCYGRMLKGGSAREPQRWQRPDARRSIGAREARADVGFRVMRPLDPNP